MVEDNKPKENKSKHTRIPVSAEEVRAKAKSARDSLELIHRDIIAATQLLDKVSREDASFSSRDSLTHLMKSLDDSDIKNLLRETHRVLKSRLQARANQ